MKRSKAKSKKQTKKVDAGLHTKMFVVKITDNIIAVVEVTISKQEWIYDDAAFLALNSDMIKLAENNLNQLVSKYVGLSEYSLETI